MRPLWVLTFFALAGLDGGCRRRDTPSPSPKARPSVQRVAPLIDELARPQPLHQDGEAQLRAALRDRIEASAVPPAPSVGKPGLPLAERPDLPIGPRQLYTMFANRLLDDGANKKGQTSERLLRIEPVLRMVSNGTGTLTFETLEPIQGVSAYLGHRMPEDPLGLPRYRQRVGSFDDPVETSKGYRYVLPFDLKRLLRKHYDVGRVLQRKGGVAVWRLELLDRRRGTSVVFDGETAFRCEPCQGEGAAFVQLPSLRLGPFIDGVGRDGAIVSFATDAATAAWVVVHEGSEERRIYASPAPGTSHEIPLIDLEPGTRFRYQPVVLDARGELHIHRGATFETEPEQLTRFEFIALSDSRSGFGAADEQYGGTNARVLRDLLEMSLARGRPRAVVFVGDLIDGYTTWPRSFSFQLEMWKRAVQPIHAHVPIYEVMGNHEALLDVWAQGWGADKQSPSAEDVFAAQFVNPPGAPAALEGAPTYDENTYSFDIGTAHLAVINSNYQFRSHPGNPKHPAGFEGHREGWVDDVTLEWLDADLAQARKAGQKHLFVFTHEPGFPNGGHVQDGLYWGGRIPEVLTRRAELYAILGEHGVTAIVHGDEHNYSRLLVDHEVLGAPLEQPVWHLVSGAAGAPFYAQDQSVPWADRVDAFDARQHYLRFLIDGDACTIEAISREGGLVDRFEAATKTRLP